jgi:opacity protein-like surface antigen
VKRILSIVAAFALAGAAPAAAQVQGALASGRVVQMNHRLGGGYLQFDKSSATLLGQLRLSFYPNLDFGFQGGLARIDVDHNTRTSVKLGGDFRGQLATQNGSFPLDIALGGTLGVETADNFSILSVGPTVTVSRTLDLSGRWVGLAGATLLYSRVDVGQQNTTDTSLPIRVGVQYLPNPYLVLHSEVQAAVSDEVRDDFSFTFGVLFPF